MKRRLMTILLLLSFSLTLVGSAQAANHSFHLPTEIVNVYWQQERTANARGSTQFLLGASFPASRGAAGWRLPDIHLTAENTIWVVLSVVAVIYLLIQTVVIRWRANRLLAGITDEIIVTLDRPNGIYEPGETVSVTVMLRPRKDMKLTGGQVKLIGMEGHQEWQHDEYSPRTLEWVYKQFWSGEPWHLGQTTLPGGAFQHYDIQFSVPANARLSCEGEKLRVRWQISVELNRPGRLPNLYPQTVPKLQVTTRALGQVVQ